jgi:hypothetical protein
MMKELAREQRHRIMRTTLILTLVLAGCATSTPEPTTAGPLKLEMYQVQDLVVCAGDMGGCDIKDHPQGCDRLRLKLKRGLPEAPWDQGDWAMEVQNELLIVRATESFQQAVLARLIEVRGGLPKEK